MSTNTHISAEIKRKFLYLILSICLVIVSFFGLGATHSKDMFFVIFSCLSFVWAILCIDGLMQELQNGIR